MLQDVFLCINEVPAKATDLLEDQVRKFWEVEASAEYISEKGKSIWVGYLSSGTII